MDVKLNFLEDRIYNTEIIDSAEITYIRLLLIITSLYLDDIKYSIDNDSFDIYTKKIENLKKQFNRIYIEES